MGRNWFQFSVLGYHPSYLINNTRDENNMSFINMQGEAEEAKDETFIFLKYPSGIYFLFSLDESWDSLYSVVRAQGAQRNWRTILVISCWVPQ